MKMDHDPALMRHRDHLVLCHSTCAKNGMMSLMIWYGDVHLDLEPCVEPFDPKMLPALKLRQTETTAVGCACYIESWC